MAADNTQVLEKKYSLVRTRASIAGIYKGKGHNSSYLHTG